MRAEDTLLGSFVLGLCDTIPFLEAVEHEEETTGSEGSDR